jgi:O-antigen ligase
MSRASLPDPAAPPLRLLVLVLLFAAPLAFGAVQEFAFIPLLVASSAAGLLSWAKGHWARAQGSPVPLVPGRNILLALHGLVLFQLVPLPPWLLKILSPGSFSFYNNHLLLPLTAWRPISVSPPDTLRGLAFLAGFSLLYGAVFREFEGGRDRRRLAGTVVVAGLVITVVAFVQARSAEPRLLYGIWRPTWDWAVYGPYANRNHFAGYMVMTIPLSFGFALEALARLVRDWRSRRVGWLALGGPAGSALVLRATVAMALVAGLVKSESRGGVVAFALSTLVLPFAGRHGRRAFALVVLVGGLGIGWIGLDSLQQHFATRGIQGSRIEMWQDMLPLVRDFPVFGTGLNAFASAYAWYQTLPRRDWFGEAHNEYFQALLDLGVVGALLVGVLLAGLFRDALRAASRGPFELGLLGALLAVALHNLVEFNWQIPANAATYVVLAAATRRVARQLDPSLNPP